MDLVGIGVHLSILCLQVPSPRPYVLIQQQVFTSYYVEAVQVTIFLVAFSVWHMRKYATSKRNSRFGLLPGTQYHQGPPTRASRLGAGAIGAFRSSLNAFLGTSMLFSIAMLAAALYMSGKGTAQRRSPLGNDIEILSDSALYDMMLSMLAATFSIFPVMILYAMQRRESDFSFNKRENQVWVSRAVLMLIWMLGAAEVYASLYGNFDYDYREYENTYHRENCDWRGSVHYWDGSKSFRSSADRPSTVSFFLLRVIYVNPLGMITHLLANFADVAAFSDSRTVPHHRGARDMAYSDSIRTHWFPHTWNSSQAVDGPLAVFLALGYRLVQPARHVGYTGIFHLGEAQDR